MPIKARDSADKVSNWLQLANTGKLFCINFQKLVVCSYEMKVLSILALLMLVNVLWAASILTPG
jgi:hypothetical protein